VLSRFMTAILDRRAPTIFGDGEQSRDFTYVEDVVRLNLLAARTKGISGKMYNGGNGGSITLNQAWSALQKIEGVAIAALYGPARSGDVLHSQADTTRAHAELGYVPRFSFEEGLRQTLAWFRAHR
jgi:UDP-glucose 4-epimerase